MAGGRDWFFEGKEDGEDQRTLVDESAGNGETLTYYRAKKVVFVIYKQVKASNIDLGPGDYGKVSGMLQVNICGTVKTRTGTTAKFLCTSDDTRKEAGPGKWAIRRQTWEMLYPEEQYNPTTGEVIE